jgi:hypothetical protein
MEGSALDGAALGGDALEADGLAVPLEQAARTSERPMAGNMDRIRSMFMRTPGASTPGSGADDGCPD